MNHLTLKNARDLCEALLATRDVEIGCDDCLMQVASYCETELAGKEIPEALRLVREHLEICAECREECQALLSAMLEGSR
ncbi:MAG: hypothetical protein GEV06_26510 [Luteitalea sp.]|nr:hypothetical protein [Luteitalea sp.]